MLFTLVFDGTNIDLHDPDEGMVVTSYDPAPPDERAVVQLRSNAAGTIDQTSLDGGRAITMGLTILKHPHAKQELRDLLMPYLRTRNRMELWVQTEDDGPVRRATVRPAPWTEPWGDDSRVDMTLSFKFVGSPYFRSVDDRTVSVLPAESDPGLTFPVTFPISFPAAPSHSHSAINFGTVEAQWTAQAFGPFTGLVLRNETTGLHLSLPTLTVADGDVAVISSEDQTVTIDGSDRRSTIDFLNSDWWPLEPGLNELTVSASSHSAPASVLFTYADTYM